MEKSDIGSDPNEILGLMRERVCLRIVISLLLITLLPLPCIHHTQPHPMPHQYPFFYKLTQIDNRLLIATSCQPCILGAIEAGIENYD